MKTALLIVINVFAACIPGQGQRVLNTGDIYTYTPLSLPFLSISPVSCFARSSVSFSFSLEAGSIQAGDSFLFEFSSGGRSGSVLWQGSQSPDSVFLIDTDPSGTGGSVRFTVLGGSVTIDSLSIRNSNVNHAPLPGESTCTLTSYGETSVPVPEPGTAALTVLGLVSFWLGRWKWSGSKKVHAASVSLLQSAGFRSERGWKTLT